MGNFLYLVQKYIITNFDTKSDIFVTAFLNLLKIASTSLNSIDEITLDKDRICFDFNNDALGTFESTSFCQYLKQIEATSCKLNDNSCPRNEYKNKQFFQHLLKHYIPFTPLWSGIFLKSKQRLSNAPVERWFGIVKNTIA